MRKLTNDEDFALALLEKHGGWCPGDDAYFSSDASTEHERRRFISVLKSLMRKKRVVAEDTQDGPKFHAA